MLKYKTQKVVEVQDWDALVVDTYGRPYSFQQQDGCKARGIFHLSIPCNYAKDYEYETIPELLNYKSMGVTFKAWQERPSVQKLSHPDASQADYYLNLWWTRMFYPDVDMIAKDLHEKGLIEEGDYIINIDW